MDFVRSYFVDNEPLTSWTLFFSPFFQISTRPNQHWSGKKVFNWSEVHLCWSNFLQNLYFSCCSISKRLVQFQQVTDLQEDQEEFAKWLSPNPFGDVVNHQFDGIKTSIANMILETDFLKVWFDSVVMS